tara:strand:- start:3665 stop:3970 length:306 start_codon:yes stop_codon:yes gene_type:complete
MKIRNKKYYKQVGVVQKYKELIDNATSTNVDKMKYDTETKILIIRFNDGSYYTYYKVPEKIYDHIRDGNSVTLKGKTPSVGSAVHKYLIRGGYKYKRGGSL